MPLSGVLFYNRNMSKELTPDEWLELNKHYLDRWYGKEVQVGKRWCRLKKPLVNWGASPQDRESDAMEDSDKNVWWVRQELEVMEKNGKVRASQL